MNKQELIEKLNQEIKELKSTEASCFELGSKTEELKFTNRIMGLQLALNWARRLNEPQKVKVPAFVAEWIETAKKEKRTLHYSMQDIDDACYYHKGDNPLYRWMFVCDDSSEHQEIFARAWLDGYEVEESKWVVNEGDLVIRKGEHEAKVYFVESVDDDGILLVNGIKDEFFTDLDDRSVGQESINYFYENFRLLAKKENLEAEKVEV